MANPLQSMEFLKKRAEELRRKGARRVQGTHPVPGSRPRRLRDGDDLPARKKLRLGEVDKEESDKEESDKEESDKEESDKEESDTEESGKEESDRESNTEDREEDKVKKRNRKERTLNLDVEKTAREVEEELTNEFMVVENKEKLSKEKCAEWVQKAAEAGFFLMPAQDDVEYVED